MQSVGHFAGRKEQERERLWPWGRFRQSRAEATEWDGVRSTEQQVADFETGNGRGKLPSLPFFLSQLRSGSIRWFQNSILLSAVVFSPFNLFTKEIEAQRTGILVKVDILAIKLIALHEQLVARFTTEGRLVF
jgi:hypothetical protein